MPKKKTTAPPVPPVKIEPTVNKWHKLLLVAGVGLFLIIALLVSVELGYRNRIFPGVVVGDVNVGNMTITEAQAQLDQRFAQIQEVKLVHGVNKWSTPSSSLELNYKTDEMVQAAYSVGRGQNIFSDWQKRLAGIGRGNHLDLRYSFSESALQHFLAPITSEINIPATEPEITFEPVSKTVRVTTGANGQQVDERLLWQNLQMAFGKLDTTNISLPVVELKPQLSQEQVLTTQQRSQQFLGKTLNVIGTEANQKWEIGTEQIFAWIDPTTNGWKKERIAEWVAELAKTIDRQPENASFHFEEPGRVTEFKPAKDGLVVQQTQMVNDMIKALQDLQTGTNQSVALVLTSSPPAVGNGDVNNLGITQLLAKGESWFTGSITNRIFNIQKAASLLNGVLVPPGKTFSFNGSVGEISQVTGFKSAFIIKDGQTLLGDGGGVCQVSSTLFRAVLNAGLPINERTAHAYRVSYYEQNYQPGFDATIFQPAPDFKFINDTPAHVLIQTEFDEKAKKLTFYLYGTSDGRKAEVSKSRTWDVVPAPPDLYIDDPTLPVGQVRQTEHKSNGAKVAFDWKVTRGDEVLQERTFYSNYRAWQAVYLRGIKTN